MSWCQQASARLTVVVAAAERGRRAEQRAHADRRDSGAKGLHIESPRSHTRKVRTHRPPPPQNHTHAPDATRHTQAYWPREPRCAHGDRFCAGVECCVPGAVGAQKQSCRGPGEHLALRSATRPAYPLSRGRDRFPLRTHERYRPARPCTRRVWGPIVLCR